MNEGMRLVVRDIDCPECGARKGQLCLRKSSTQGHEMTTSVHTARKRCPVCTGKYTERSGIRYRHVDSVSGENRWCNAKNIQ